MSYAAYDAPRIAVLGVLRQGCPRALAIKSFSARIQPLKVASAAAPHLHSPELSRAGIVYRLLETAL